jgi:rfaE bifunctional protein kinase chain/domain
MPTSPTDLAQSAARLKRLVPRLRGKRVGVVGDLMLDRYLWGSVTRISPEAVVPVVDFEGQNECLGGAGNVAANLAALGARVEMFGVIGAGKAPADEPGESLRKDLRAANISDKGVLSDARRITTVKTRIIARHQHIVRVDRERREPLHPDTQGRLLRALSSSLKNLDALVVSDYDKGIITEDFVEKIVAAAHKQKVPVFAGPKRPLLYAYRGARALICNAKEAGQFLTRTLNDDSSFDDAGRKLLSHFGCEAVVITRSEKGMTLFEESSPKPLHIPATSFEVTYARVGKSGIDRGSSGRQVFDVTGAGDTVLSVLALAAAAGAPLPDAARLANAAAGVVVGKLGTASVAPGELLNLLTDLSR